MSGRNTQLFALLQEEAHTISGAVYHPASDHWFFRTKNGNVHFKFYELKKLISNELFLSLKLYLRHQLEEMFESSVRSYLVQFNRYVKFIINNSNDGYVTGVTLSDVINYFAEEDSPSSKTFLKAMLLKWHSLGYSGIGPDVADYLSKHKIKQKRKNLIVLTADPLKGAYTNQEYHALLDEIDRAFQDNSVTLEQYVIASLFNYFGFRPEQLAQMKTGNYIVEIEENGSRRYILNVPRVKQGEIEDGVELHPYPVQSEFAQVIEFYLSQVFADFENSQFFQVLPFEELYMFPDWRREDFGFRSKSTRISYLFNHINKKIDVISERTGEKLHIFPYRSRHNIGTRAALEGKTAHVVAVLLDHSSTDSVKHYVEFARNIATEIDDAIHDDIAPVIAAFKGEIISELPIRGTRKISRVRSNHPALPDAGLCLEPSGCGIYSTDGEAMTILAQPPFSCYPCPFFNAWADKHVHVEHLGILERERSRRLKAYDDDGHASQHSMAHSLDLAINAVRQVVDMIDAGIISTPGEAAV